MVLWFGEALLPEVNSQLLQENLLLFLGKAGGGGVGDLGLWSIKFPRMPNTFSFRQKDFWILFLAAISAFSSQLCVRRSLEIHTRTNYFLFSWAKTSSGG